MIRDPANMTVPPAADRGAVVVFAVLSVVLFAISAYNYLVFHTLVELFALVVAFGAFGVAWFSRRWIATSSLLMLGIGYLFVGLTDLAHMLTYKGVTITSFASVETAIEFWLIGRGLEAVAFLVAVAWPMARFSQARAFAAFGTATALVSAAAVLGLFPATYVEGEGLTAFKIAAEYAIVAVLAAAWLLLRRRTGEFDPVIRRMLMLSLAVKVAAELCFTLYVDPYGFSNFAGHILKVVSYYLFLRAVIETGLTRPQALVFGAIEREKELAGEVRRHATTLDAVLDASLDTVMMLDRAGRFLFVSRAGEALLGRPAAELGGRTWREAGLAVAVMGPIEELCRRVLDGGRPVTEECAVPGPDHARCLEAQVSPVAARDGQPPEAVVAVIRDISQRKGMEESLKATLDDNRVLMMEVHHRVRNNLQIVSSLLQMQGWRVTDPALRAHFDEACGRILSLSKVHEMLYNEENAASVDFARYVRALVDDLFKMYAVREDWVSFRMEPGSLTLPLDKAVPLALIVHELVTNAIRHGFGEQGGELRLGIAAEGGDGVLRIMDDGGARPGPAGDRAAPLGMRMVEVLVKQIQGVLTERQDGGIAIEVRFPLRDPVPRPTDAALVI